VEKSCSADASRAFFSFTERHGTVTACVCVPPLGFF
jgi:hypothetical protein